MAESLLLAGRFTLAALLGLHSHGPITTAIRKGELRSTDQGGEQLVIYGQRGGQPHDLFNAALEARHTDAGSPGKPRHDLGGWRLVQALHPDKRRRADLFQPGQRGSTAVPAPGQEDQEQAKPGSQRRKEWETEWVEIELHDPQAALKQLQQPTRRDEIISDINKGLDLWKLDEGQECRLFEWIYDAVVSHLARAEDLLDDNVKDGIVDWANDLIDVPVISERIEGWGLSLAYDLLIGSVVKALMPYIEEATPA